jgi:hypothetical protein
MSVHNAQDQTAKPTRTRTATNGGASRRGRIVIGLRHENRDDVSCAILLGVSYPDTGTANLACIMIQHNAD